MTGVMETESSTQPVDITTMRQTIRRLLPPDEADPLTDADLDMLTALLRGQLALIIPEVQAMAEARPRDDIPRYVAFAAVNEARGRLGRAPVTLGGNARLVYARRLARALRAMCDHHEALTQPSVRP